MATTTNIKTEAARPSLTQNIEDLYNNLHTGGTFDSKKDVVTDGSRNERVDGIKERTHTVRGFKTKMMEGQSEMLQANGVKETTTLLTSVYGHHSNKRYKQ